jgi:hypothetical protein
VRAGFASTIQDFPIGGSNRRSGFFAAVAEDLGIQKDLSPGEAFRPGRRIAEFVATLDRLRVSMVDHVSNVVPIHRRAILRDASRCILLTQIVILP